MWICVVFLMHLTGSTLPHILSPKSVLCPVTPMTMISSIFCRIRLLFEYDETYPEDLPPFQFKTFIERKEMMVSFKVVVQ